MVPTKINFLGKNKFRTAPFALGDESMVYLIVHEDRCVGCRICEIICSLSHEGIINPNLSRIHVIGYKGRKFPIMCLQCEDAPCELVCPVEAIRLQDNVRIVDDNKCIRCKMCTLVCPIGGVLYDYIEHKMIRCDLCGGDPQCVRYCPMDAIEVIPDNKVSKIRKMGVGALYEEGD